MSRPRPQAAHPAPGTGWRSSSRSQTSNCVEVARLGDARSGPVALRDSKDRGGPILVFDRPGWLGFLAGAKLGEFRGRPGPA
ncbi:DUF397 domain-containing protein [Solwaraspora sp. WMMD1047]|uniref:DUF397 domain-containing protein n=1 Tax=Solwaraspora sp. WMMD1047 TaxID=3016102 RepID=UPI0024160401|nr:DUF397 domain-containing protein [Solwaraspora sp. WMMD1047]MDG4833199.1 DUF397 domain-containing protein [Solwaraspora sp. WMMD1047]